MADENNVQPIIIIKKKAGHGGHHGGAWKVAYADFVTAMMAFFMVMWLMNSTPKVKEAVGAYFRDPTGSGNLTGSTMSGAGDSLEITKDDMGKLKDELQRAMQKMPEFKQLQDQVSMTVTGEGLRIELLETEKGLFFASGQLQPSPSGEEVLTTIAGELGKMPNNLLIEGHTDAKPFNTGGEYTNWELSADRANAARKLMETHGLRPGQVVQVRGFADRRLRVPNDPSSASNRRISIIVQYITPPPGAEPEAAKAPAAPKKATH